MRRYIETMKTRPEHHQRAFALSVAGGVTLALFGIWSFVLVNKPDTIADANENQNSLAAVIASDDTPGGSLSAQNAEQDSPSALQNFQTGVENSYNDVRSGIQSPTSAYQDARDEGLNNGQ